MTRDRRARRRAINIQKADVQLLTTLAVRINARPRKPLDPLALCYRYLRRFHSLLGWHRGAHHVGRFEFGPMIFQPSPDSPELAVDGREPAT